MTLPANNQKHNNWVAYLGQLVQWIGISWRVATCHNKLPKLPVVVLHLLCRGVYCISAIKEFWHSPGPEQSSHRSGDLSDNKTWQVRHVRHDMCPITCNSQKMISRLFILSEAFNSHQKPLGPGKIVLPLFFFPKACQSQSQLADFFDSGLTFLV